MSIPSSVLAAIVSRAAGGTSGLVGDALAEAGRERREQHRADDRRAERGPEVLGRALKPARLAGLRGRDGGHDHVPELRGEQPGARADERERDLEAGVVEGHVERREHHDRADADRDQPDLRDGARRAPGGDPRAQQREDEHRHRQRKQALAGLERVEPQHDLQVHRDDEEGAHQDELLADQRREPRPQLRDAAAAPCRAAGRGRGGRGAAPTRRTPTAARARRAP